MLLRRVPVVGMQKKDSDVADEAQSKCGELTLKLIDAGFAGHDVPCAVLPSVIGSPKVPSIMDESGEHGTTFSATMSGLRPKTFRVSNEMLIRHLRPTESAWRRARSKMYDDTRRARGDPSCFVSVRIGTPNGKGVFAHSFHVCSDSTFPHAE